MNPGYLSFKQKFSGAAYVCVLFFLVVLVSWVANHSEVDRFFMEHPASQLFAMKSLVLAAEPSRQAAPSSAVSATGKSSAALSSTAAPGSASASLAVKHTGKTDTPELSTADAVASENSAAQADANGWENDVSWTGYTCTAQQDGCELVSFERVKPYAYIAKQIPLSYTNGQLTNAVSLSFQNIGKSVARIDFYLQGDPEMLIGQSDNSYLEYYREKIGTYTPGGSDETVNLTLDVFAAIENLKGHMIHGVKLVMLIESSPDAQGCDGKGELLLYYANGITVSYPNNTLRPWASTGHYTIDTGQNDTVVRYSQLSDYDAVEAGVINQQKNCGVFHLELNNIDRSAESITIRVWDKDGRTATMHASLKNKAAIVSLKYNLADDNPELGQVSKIALYIDSDPYYATSDKSGSLEIVSAYFAAS